MSMLFFFKPLWRHLGAIVFHGVPKAERRKKKKKKKETPMIAPPPTSPAPDLGAVVVGAIMARRLRQEEQDLAFLGALLEGLI
jgi:hypothetical protein